MFFKAAKAVAVAASLIDGNVDESSEELDMEDLIGKSEPPKPVDSRTPKAVGLVEGKIFDPQVHFDILTALFGVHKGTETVHKVSCPSCGYASTLPLDGPELDMDAEVGCPECDREGDLDDFYDATVTETVSSRDPSEQECGLVYEGPGYSHGGDCYGSRSIKNRLKAHWDHLNGYENDCASTDWGLTQELHELKPLTLVVGDTDNHNDWDDLG